MSRLASMLPGWAVNPLRFLRDKARAVPYYGKGRYCPVCGRTSRRFRRFGLTPREDAQCVHCGSLERHRFCWLYLKERTDLFKGGRKRMLHVAPEPCFQSRFRQALGSGYLSADLVKPSAMVKMDITKIQYPDCSFDVIYCSHVLEHVADDRRAMRELHRILDDRGWAVLLVPITSEKTIEDPSIVDPRERTRVFGQHDHVRRYGPDYVDRLREAGFRVEIATVKDLFGKEDAIRMGLTPASGEIYSCSKR